MTSTSSSSPYSISRYQGLVIWVIAFILIMLGIYLSRIEYLGQEWLTRSGCAVVILGIWSGLGGLAQERIMVGRLRWMRRNAIVRARAALHAKEASLDEIEREVGQIEDAFEKQNYALTEKLKVSLGILEFSILITGTFTWGFGDILVQYVFSG